MMLRAHQSLSNKELSLDMPIVSQVNQVLFDGKSPKEALADLMMRDPRIESSDLPWEG